jgi:hypothetical protein
LVADSRTGDSIVDLECDRRRGAKGREARFAAADERIDLNTRGWCWIMFLGRRPNG